MGRIRIARTVAAIGAAALACLALASPAPAKLKLKYVSQPGTVDPDSVEEVNVFCPEDYKVTGGGAHGSGGYNLNKIIDSYPIDGPDSGARPDDGWRATIWSTSSSPLDVESQAICAKKLKLKNKRRVITPGGVDDPPTCSKGYSATGGGFDTAGTFASPVNVISSRPSDGTDNNDKAESWFSNAETAGGSPATHTTHVMCARNKDVKLRYESEGLTVLTQDQNSGGALCEEDEEVVGVGGAANSQNAALVSIFSIDTNDPDTTLDDGVDVIVDNFNVTAISPEAYAVCAKDKKN